MDSVSPGREVLACPARHDRAAGGRGRRWDNRTMLSRLRAATCLARLVLAWFVCSLGVAVAAPLVHPSAAQMVCTGKGLMKLVVYQTDGSLQEVGTALKGTADCPMCGLVAAPPPETSVSVEPPHPLAYALTPLRAAEIAWLTAPPLPARGPPLL